MDVLSTYPTYDRTTINSWEDVEFKRALTATGRKKLIMAALWTEACLSFPARWRPGVIMAPGPLKTAWINVTTLSVVASL